MSNYSSDLFWEITRTQSSFLVKRGSGTAQVVFSREPLNLTNKHTRKQSGLVNEKAIGVQPSKDHGVELITKTNDNTNGNRPEKMFYYTTLRKHNRKVYASIVNATAKHLYRPDLRQDAVSRASAILASQKSKKPISERKLRGLKAIKASAKA